MIEIDYLNFESDCKETFGKYLIAFNFKEIENSANQFEKKYENEFWKIEISMLSNFPHIGVSFEFKSKNNDRLHNNILDQILKIDDKKNRELYKKYFTREHYNKSIKEQYKIEMKYCVEKLNIYYKPLLTGEFTYEKYLFIVNQNS